MMIKKLTWKILPFEALNTNELYNIIKLRVNVFVVEQNCPYPELDDKDQMSFHQMGFDGSELAAYSRLLPKGVSYEESSIGRVVTHSSFRGKGLGHEMLEVSKTYIKANLDQKAIRLSAQTHLTNFYEKHKFQSTGKTYLEDGIPHTEMLLKFNNQ